MERKITVEIPGTYKEDYQIRMLRSNAIQGLLGMRAYGNGGKTVYEYNVSGKVAMMAMYEKSDISKEDVKQLLQAILSVIKETERFLLNIHCIMLNPEYIFYGEEKYSFCYYPANERDIWCDFRTLTEYLVKHADYKEQDCIHMVFALHKGAAADNYNPEELIGKCLSLTAEETYEEWKKEKEEEPVAKMEQPVAKMEQGDIIMEETDHMWLPVKRLLNRRRKPKWGDFDGLYVEEDEL